MATRSRSIVTMGPLYPVLGWASNFQTCSPAGKNELEVPDILPAIDGSDQLHAGDYRAGPAIDRVHMLDGPAFLRRTST
ncbi:MAG: hypothetical protein ACRD1R_05620 [Acidobacteriota bacterium]